MKPTLEDGLRALEEAAELAKSVRIELTDDYLQLIARVEAMSRNQSGADKSRVWKVLDWSTKHFAKAVRAR